MTLDTKTQLALMQKDIEFIKSSIKNITDYEVTKKRLMFVEKIVYTTAGTVLIGFLTAIIALVLK